MLRIPIKHGEGRYALRTKCSQLEDNDQIVPLRKRGWRNYRSGEPQRRAAQHRLFTNARRNVVGLMPHPEHAVEALLGSEDGRKLFTSVLAR
jgi:phosphoribosylformylglycinamidine synthase